MRPSVIYALRRRFSDRAHTASERQVFGWASDVYYTHTFCTSSNRLAVMVVRTYPKSFRPYINQISVSCGVLALKMSENGKSRDRILSQSPLGKDFRSRGFPLF